MIEAERQAWLEAAASSVQEAGRKLRDDFAMSALNGMLAGKISSPAFIMTEDHYASAAYKYADAMLKARSTKDNE